MEALKHGMLMQRELSAISAQLKHFQGLSYIYYGCNSPVPWCLLLTSFWCCSVLDLKCSPVEPIFVSAAASKGYFLLIVLTWLYGSVKIRHCVLKYDATAMPMSSTTTPPQKKKIMNKKINKNSRNGMEFKV